MNPALLHALLESAFRAAPPMLASERDLQDSVERALVAERVIYDREHRLDAKSRPDFFVEGPVLGRGIAVEVKIADSLSSLTRQLFRYADHPAVTGILVVTTLHRLRRLPPTMCGRPVVVLDVGDYLL